MLDLDLMLLQLTKVTTPSRYTVGGGSIPTYRDLRGFQHCRSTASCA